MTVVVLGCGGAAPPVPMGPGPTPLSVGSADAGRHLVMDVLRCDGCHGADLGGSPAAPNLTRGEGGVGARYANADAWALAVRAGVTPDGRQMAGMPWRRWAALSAQDLADMAAWLGSVPPVDRLGGGASTAPGLGTAGAEGATTVVRPVARPDSAYGLFLLSATGCSECHADSLRGWLGAGGTGAAMAVAVSAAGPPPHQGGWPGLTMTELDALWSALRYGDGLSDSR